LKNFVEILKSSIINALDFSFDEEFIKSCFEKPKNPDMGDVAFACFRLSRELKKAPPVIANSIIEKISLPSVVEKCETVSGYVNFYFKKTFFEQKAQHIVNKISTKGSFFDKENKEKILVEYSSPNVAKNFGVHNLRSTVIGQSLYNLIGEMGYEPVGINHLGDWGTQFGKLIVAYDLWGNEKALRENAILHLNELYVKFHEESEKDSQLEEKARECFCCLENGDEGYLSKWDFKS
jgi:arginyl-tRNA synthetase